MNKKISTTNVLLIVLIVLVLGLFVFVVSNKKEIKEGENPIVQKEPVVNNVDQNVGDQNQIKTEEKVVKKEEVKPSPMTVKNTLIIFNGQKYNLNYSDCGIGGYMAGGVSPTWSLNLTLKKESSASPSFGWGDIYFKSSSITNTIDSLLTKGVNVASKNTTISSMLTSNSFSTKPYNTISVVWNNVNKNGNTFSGDGYIKINNDIKPNEAICNGTEKVWIAEDQQYEYLSPSSPSYTNYNIMCPTPVVPKQTIYFKCVNGSINTNISVPLT